MFNVVTNSFCKTNDGILRKLHTAEVNFKQTVVKAELLNFDICKLMCTLLFFFISFFSTMLTNTVLVNNIYP